MTRPPPSLLSRHRLSSAAEAGISGQYLRMERSTRHLLPSLSPPSRITFVSERAPLPALLCSTGFLPPLATGKSPAQAGTSHFFRNTYVPPQPPSCLHSSSLPFFFKKKLDQQTHLHRPPAPLSPPSPPPQKKNLSLFFFFCRPALRGQGVVPPCPSTGSDLLFLGWWWWGP